MPETAVPAKRTVPVWQLSLSSCCRIVTAA
jgi:hypothetical protein